MKIFREIAARIWALWAIISFVGSFLIIFIPSMFSYLYPDPKGTGVLIKVAKAWMNGWLFLVGCTLRIKGLQHFDKNQTYIVTYNHNALLDVPLSCPYVPGPNKTIAKSSFAKVPLFGWFYKKGAILVDRKNETSRKESYLQMRRVLENGMHMCIYPEGTRNRSKEPLKPFHDGAFRLAVESGKPIIPALIFNTKKANPANKVFYFLPQALEMHYLPPVNSINETVASLKEKVFGIMKEYYQQHQS
ncbi:MAG: lysophospholipid acyltransferase family protein [Flavihumibacter sp.]|nr:lysophospholipid acyltransferase family protein [Flavihumibacter sp.]